MLCHYSWKFTWSVCPCRGSWGKWRNSGGGLLRLLTGKFLLPCREKRGKEKGKWTKKEGKSEKGRWKIEKMEGGKLQMRRGQSAPPGSAQPPPSMTPGDNDPGHAGEFFHLQCQSRSQVTTHNIILPKFNRWQHCKSKLSWNNVIWHTFGNFSCMLSSLHYCCMRFLYASGRLFRTNVRCCRRRIWKKKKKTVWWNNYQIRTNARRCRMRT